MSFFKRIISATALLLSSVLFVSGQTKDTDIVLIMRTFDSQPIDFVIEKADHLISTGKDSTEKAFIASVIFDYYYSSEIMGYDSIALYIADNYFLNGKYRYPNEEGLILLKLFTEFNRQSMIGMPAPELSLPDSLGNIVSINDIRSKYKIVYFYDDQCQICKVETPLLNSFLNRLPEGENVTVFRIFTQDDRNRWSTYIRENAIPHNIRHFELWDPAFDSDFHRKYAVLTTPQMFLIDENNIIVGRNLDTESLLKLYRYYEEQSAQLQLFFGEIFASVLPEDPSAAVDTLLVHKLIDVFWENSKDNPKLFKEIFLELYQFLKGSSEYDLQRAAAYLGEKYIVGKPALWQNHYLDDGTRTFTEQIAFAVELFHRNPLGKTVSDLTLKNIKNKPVSIYSTQGKYTILYFHNFDCALCEAATSELKSIFSKYSDKEVEMIAIYTGKDKKAWKKHIKSVNGGWIDLYDPDGKSGMFSKFDLSGVPAIYLLDEDKTTIAKDITPFTLEELLNNLL